MDGLFAYFCLFVLYRLFKFYVNSLIFKFLYLFFYFLNFFCIHLCTSISCNIL